MLSLQLPRAIGTQALSGAGILKMFNKATDAVSKMTIKMNESDIVSVKIFRELLLSTWFGCFEAGGSLTAQKENGLAETSARLVIFVIPFMGNEPCSELVHFQWFEEKLQEVECEEQRLRKLHAVVETLVNHRKGNRPRTWTTEFQGPYVCSWMGNLVWALKWCGLRGPARSASTSSAKGFLLANFC